MSWATNARPPPMSSASAIDANTRQVDANRFHKKSGVTNSSARRRATAIGPGRMNSGNPRAIAHHAISTSTTSPSPIRRSAATDGTDDCSARIVTRHARLQRRQDELIDAVHKGDDQNDCCEDRGSVEFLAGEIDHITETAVAAEQFRGQGYLPGDAEHDPQCRKNERIERRYDYQDQHPGTQAREAFRHLNNFAVDAGEARRHVDEGERNQ